MKYKLALLLSVFSLTAFLPGPRRAVAAGQPLHIHLLSGTKEYNSEASLRAYAAHLREKFHVWITASWVSDGAKQLPGVESLKQADLLILYARRMQLEEPYMAAVRQHWEQGKPIIGIRTASHAFSRDVNPRFDRQVLGGNYEGHFGDNRVGVTNALPVRNHPVLQGVKPFASRKLYKAGPLAADTVVLQYGTVEPGMTHPVTWVHEYHGGRMFYTSLGVPEDFQQPAFIQLLDNAVGWTTRGKATVKSAPAECLVYFGTYTGKQSKGIYVSRMQVKTGKLTDPVLAAELTNPSFLAVHPNQKWLYAVGEVSGGGKQGGVTGFALHPKTGQLTRLNQVSSGGAGPCHLAVDHGGRSVLVANYGGGSIAVLPIAPDGRLGPATCFIQHQGSSINPRRQKGPHAHGIYPDADNRFVFVPDLGLDQVMIYAFDADQRKLTPHQPAFAKVKPGAGPRHLAFHPNGSFAYVINEMGSTITAFSYAADQGALREIQTVSTLPPGFTGQNTTAEIAVHPSGKFVFGSNRGHDSIVVFAVDAQTGKLSYVEHEPTQGQIPRNFAVDPTGHWLLAANQRSDTVVSYRINPATGQLTATGQSLPVGSPVCIVFVPVAP